MNRAHRVALFCGACPLIVGISIFLLWLITRWDWLMMAGLFTVYGGVVIFLVGATALARFHVLASRTPELPRSGVWRATLRCAGLLLSNFVAAGAIMATVLFLDGWMGESQTRQIARVTEAQQLTFQARDARHLSGVTLHVHGHIDGTAVITGPLGETREYPISGNVDLLTGGDWFDPTIKFEYSPTNVTSGQLTFELEFH